MKIVGIDAGSTTIKYVVMDEQFRLLRSSYARHLSRVTECVKAALKEIEAEFAGETLCLGITGSAGIGIAEKLEIPFIQEVHAAGLAVKAAAPDTEAVIELGGEDAKVLFLGQNPEARMNGSCAGGTGAFIDQMAVLLNVSAEQLGTLAAERGHLYKIASRCGVFAKADIQPLLDQGAAKEDVAASILYAVVRQTIGGLAHGRKLEGKVMYLGGPLTCIPQLRAAFDEVLGLRGVCPEHSLFFGAIGAARAAVTHKHRREYSASEAEELFRRLELGQERKDGLPPFFDSREEYERFTARHKIRGGFAEPAAYREDGCYYLGIDAGSTTVKLAVIDERHALLHRDYCAGLGEPIEQTRRMLEELYRRYPGIRLRACAVTGYGEDLLRGAFGIQLGVVETVAHYMAAREFDPAVDFIMDIGGQDMKCLQIRDGMIQNIFLNEACSSGCGSFLETLAATLGCEVRGFAGQALLAEHPVDLGSRCTVFMNSAVKQAQKEGASIGDISAGLAYSVVKNAVYKVLRASGAEDMGNNIVVQGGTFLNDGVLRAFELELGRRVVRPPAAELMGAFGAALYAERNRERAASGGVLGEEKLIRFERSVTFSHCEGCQNHCRLTVSHFPDGRTAVSGNRCDRAVSAAAANPYNIYAYKRSLLSEYIKPAQRDDRPAVGIPLALNLYELLPFWHTLFSQLGFRVVVSSFSPEGTFGLDQSTIPSDTVCYPAKLVHGHIRALPARSVDAVFYPCMEYNRDEKKGDNCFNCPVIAYYPDVIEKNVMLPAGVPLLCGEITLNNRRTLVKQLAEMLRGPFGAISGGRLRRAVDAAFHELDSYGAAVRRKGAEYLNLAREKQLRTVLLAGRPYHIDTEVNHGLDALIAGMGAVVLSEDAIPDRPGRIGTGILNQWTYHSRLFEAAHFVAEAPSQDNISFVQLISFGCGIDAVTSDEARRILEARGKNYTQIKIDEMDNLGTARIRLRSLFAVWDEQED